MSPELRWSRLRRSQRLGCGLSQLHASSVVLVGAGALGGCVLPHLAMLGIPTTIIDKDVVSEENLGNQGFAENMVGLPKAQARAISLRSLNSSWRVNPVHADLSRVGLGDYAQFDLILCALDSPGARAALSAIAVHTGRAWCDAAVDPSGVPFGRVACYDPRLEDGACYVCPHDPSSLAMAMRGGVEGCPGTPGRGADAPPTLATSMLAAAVAALQVTWATEMLLGRMDGIAGMEAYLDLGGCALRRHRLVRNPRCLFTHRRFEPIEPLGVGVAGITVAETLRAASTWLRGDVQMRLWRDAIATELRCPECGVVRRPFRLLGSLSAAEMRCDCGAEMGAPAAGLLDRFGVDEAEPFVDRTWDELGLPEREIVAAGADGCEIFLRFK
ncbi:MAG: ThiF family adenylyltransferase [Candidatus Sulfopaludibacter sp.]|nr:ThiF family adenylyltransferase [Candidatus Sulfopaludibacter sp.]